MAAEIRTWIGLLAQYTMNGLMLGMMYALVAVGFTLFFGVLDVITPHRCPLPLATYAGCALASTQFA
jgi:branched-chain amino acid transport system permease protein